MLGTIKLANKIILVIILWTSANADNEATDITSSSFQTEAVRLHNYYRDLHESPPLKHNQKLEDFARKRAKEIAVSDGAKFSHPDDLEYGENLAWNSIMNVDLKIPLRLWYEEWKIYNFKKPNINPKNGHFTQMVWKGTKDVGCAQAISKGKKGGTYTVCNYEEAGNFEGEEIDNVKPATKNDTTTPSPKSTTTTKRTTTTKKPTTTRKATTIKKPTTKSPTKVPKFFSSRTTKRAHSAHRKPTHRRVPPRKRIPPHRREPPHRKGRLPHRKPPVTKKEVPTPAPTEPTPEETTTEPIITTEEEPETEPEEEEKEEEEPNQTLLSPKHTTTTESEEEPETDKEEEEEEEEPKRKTTTEEEDVETDKEEDEDYEDTEEKPKNRRNRFEDKDYNENEDFKRPPKWGRHNQLDENRYTTPWYSTTYEPHLWDNRHHHHRFTAPWWMTAKPTFPVWTVGKFMPTKATIPPTKPPTRPPIKPPRKFFTRQTDAVLKATPPKPTKPQKWKIKFRGKDSKR